MQDGGGLVNLLGRAVLVTLSLSFHINLLLPKSIRHPTFSK